MTHTDTVKTSSRFLFIEFVQGDAGISNTVHCGAGSTVIAMGKKKSNKKQSNVAPKSLTPDISIK